MFITDANGVILRINQAFTEITGYSADELAEQLAREADFEAFFEAAPAMHPNRDRITGVICGIRVEEIEDPFTRHVRQLDMLVDELAKGKAMEKILRA